LAEYRSQAGARRFAAHARPRRTVVSALVVLLVAVVIGSVSMLASLARGDVAPGRSGHVTSTAQASDSADLTDTGTDPENPADPAPPESAPPSGSAATATSAPPTRAPPAPRPKSPPLPPQPIGVAGVEAQVLALVNVERGKKPGCRPVTNDPRLAAVARAHSADMAERNYFDHTTPDGVDFATRITKAGYTWSTAGENIAAGQPDPASVMTSWMNSPGHRANILNCDFTNLGVGLAYDSRRTPYWTQDFAAPR
jgi:uncharacterized protein YkwD